MNMIESEFQEYRHCQLCPRMCGVNRLEGQTGFCGETAECRIASAVPHFGEEPCLVGTSGSGTVFFTGCSCGCFFCQNYQISHEYQGKVISESDILDMVRGLLDKGVHNLNFVTPDHWWPHIRFICRTLRNEGVDIPFLWNSSGYCRPEMLREQAEIIDIFLPDYKFAIPELARKCMGDPRYPEIALEGLEVLVDRCGFLRPYDPSGEITANRGVQVRHLVLPGEVENSLLVLDKLYQKFGPDLPLSIMKQYRPMPVCRERHFLDRMVTDEEYDRVCDRALELGFYKVFVQPDCGDENFIPDFTNTQPFKGNLKGGH